MLEKYYWLYMLECEKKRIYTGYTVDLIKRYRAHQKGQAKFTRSFKPICVLQCWPIKTKSLAMQLEYYIKQLSRLQKEILIKNPHQLFQEIPICK